MRVLASTLRLLALALLPMAGSPCAPVPGQYQGRYLPGAYDRLTRQPHSAALSEPFDSYTPYRNGQTLSTRGVY